MSNQYWTFRLEHCTSTRNEYYIVDHDGTRVVSELTRGEAETVCYRHNRVVEQLTKEPKETPVQQSSTTDVYQTRWKIDPHTGHTTLARILTDDDRVISHGVKLSFAEHIVKNHNDALDRAEEDRKNQPDPADLLPPTPWKVTGNGYIVKDDGDTDLYYAYAYRRTPDDTHESALANQRALVALLMSMPDARKAMQDALKYMEDWYPKTSEAVKNSLRHALDLRNYLPEKKS